MKKLLALALAATVSITSALALTPQELGTILQQEYAGEIPRQVWEQETVEGMLTALGDPFSHYYTAQEYADFLRQVEAGGGQTPGNTYRMDGGAGWIALNSFGEGEALAQWVREAPASHWVLDLRRNSGGELHAAVEAMGLFAGRGGSLVYLRDREGKLYGAKDQTGGYATMAPSIVLVGERTASAGELFAATLRDRQRALLIGGRTYGKGVAQSAIDKDHETYGASFADGSVLLLTTDLAFSDALISNNIIGVLPHLMVDDDLVEPVARLLKTADPTGGTEGWLRLHMARWRWYVDLSTADGPALQALLEALPPQTQLYLGQGGEEDWRPTTAVEVATRQSLWGYTPRQFPDVAGSPYADAINALKTYGILKGDQNGNYDPAGGLTRASLCALLAQAMDYPMSTAAPAFADTPADAWYTPYVTTLSALGIVNGYDDGLFHPDDPIPHQQFMTILARIVANMNHSAWASLKLGPAEADLAGGDYAAYDGWAVAGAWLLDGAWHAPARDIDPRAVTTREEAAYDLWSSLSTMGLLLN